MKNSDKNDGSSQACGTQKSAADAPEDTEVSAQDFLPRARELGAKAYRDGNQVMQDASALAKTMQEITHEVRSSLTTNLGSRPYFVMGAAATAGFVLGRGLTFGMSRTLLGIGGKMAMSALVRRATQAAVASI
jgi:hypothetical protein